MTGWRRSGSGGSRRPRMLPFAGAIVFAVFVANCADRERVVEPTPPAAPYKVGKPYQINGQWYHPKVDYDYVEIGIASWYGAEFHGKPTANGEIFDMNEVSAAHRTLPMPSVVRVTNLENGRSMKIRVNDRGPFAKGRIIDLSRRAAQLLGFQQSGTARVKVEIIADERRALAMASGGAPRTAASSSGSLGSPGTGEDASVAIVPVSTDAAALLYIQAGAYSQFDNATRARDRLSGLGPVRIDPLADGARSVYRVRLGPLSSSAEADRLLAAALRAGYPDSRLVFE
ncbi:MAG: septal ring lytic transglycosylase RlpA family protein [Rhodospirillales bacterium]